MKILVLCLYAASVCTYVTTTALDSLVYEDNHEHLVEQFEYGIQNSRVTAATIGLATVTTVNSVAVLTSGTLVGGIASLQTNRSIRYQPTRTAYATFAVRFSTGIVGTTQFIGAYDAQDGFAVGFNGTTFSILYRNSVTGATVDTLIPQASFNVDTLNGSGPSGITYIPTNFTIFRITYSWLGQAPITFQIMNAQGTFVTFHTIVQANTVTNPPLSIPQLPMRAEVGNGLLTANVSLATTGWSAGIIDNTGPVMNGRFFMVSNDLGTVTNLLGEVHVITIQNPATFAGKTNKIEAKICVLGGGSLDTGAETITLRLLRNAVLVLPSFSPVSSGNSIMNVSTAGTYTVLTGTEVFSFANATINNKNLVHYFDYPQGVVEIVILPGETLTITAFVPGALASANDVMGIIGWYERF